MHNKTDNRHLIDQSRTKVASRKGVKHAKIQKQKLEWYKFSYVHPTTFSTKEE